MCPYYYDPNLDQESQNQQQQGQLASGASPVKLASGSSTSDAMGSGGGGNASQSSQLKTGSGFQNLDKYIQANNAQGFAQGLEGKVQGQIDQGQQNQNTAAQQFKDSVTSLNQTPDQSKVQDALNHPETANAKDFQNWMKQTYQGANSLAENQDAWNKYYSQTNKAEQEANALKNQGGRFSLLDEYYGRPNYTSGEKSLDNQLIQQSGTGDQMNQLKTQADQLYSQGKENEKPLTDFATNARSQVNNSRDYVNQAWNSANADIQTQIASQTQAANKARQQDISNWQNAISTGQLSDAQLAALGLTRGQHIYGTNLSDYISYNNNPLSNEQSATDDQRARINALSQLAGLPQSYLGDKSDPGQDYNINQAGLQNQISSLGSQYQQQTQDMQNANSAQTAKEQQVLTFLNALLNAPATTSNGQSPAEDSGGKSIFDLIFGSPKPQNQNIGKNVYAADLGINNFNLTAQNVQNLTNQYQRDQAARQAQYDALINSLQGNRVI